MSSQFVVICVGHPRTLTEGSFELTKVLSEDVESTLFYAACAEQHSNHPIAKSVVHACKSELHAAQDVHEIAGRGIRAFVKGSFHEIFSKGKMVFIGNKKLMEEKRDEALALIRS